MRRSGAGRVRAGGSRPVTSRARRRGGKRAGRARVLVIGLVGGIGSGKSEVARALASLGCVVSDSDAQARAVLDRPEVRAKLVRWWGRGVVGSDGRINRAAVARIVFGDARQRRRLEELVHPLVRRARREVIARASRAGAPAVVIDSPLLLERGVDRECDVIVFVRAPRRLRRARVARRGWTGAELARRERAQMPLDRKRRRADHVVVNDADRGTLRRRVARLLERIRSEHGHTQGKDT